jgi:hypothetical protein
MKLLAIALGTMMVFLAGCESAPPQGQRTLLEQTTISDQSGTRVERTPFLTPQAPPPPVQ